MADPVTPPPAGEQRPDPAAPPPSPAPAKYPRPLQALLQSLLVAVYVLFTFFAVYRLGSLLATASLAASAFIAFGVPHAQAGRPKYLVGGYVCGAAGGLACALALHLLPGGAAGQGGYVVILLCAAAVFLTSFGMVFFKLQHPPAAALAATVVLSPSPLPEALTALACIVLLGLAKLLLARWFAKRFD